MVNTVRVRLSLRRVLTRLLCGTVLLGISLSSCHRPISSRTKTEVRVAIGPTPPWVATLVTMYSNQIPDATFSRIDIPNSSPALDELQEGLAEVSLVPADTVYIAYNKGTETKSFPHRKLRGMAVMHMSALHWIVSPANQFRGLADLRGKRVSIGTAGTGTQLTVPLLLEQLGISSREVQFERLTSEDAAKRLISGTLDAEFILSAIPTEVTAAVLATPGAHLESIPANEVSKLRDKFPFLRPVTIPAGTYPVGRDIQTVGVNFLLVCREGLDEDVVYRMLSVFFDSLPDLSRQRSALREIRFDEAPSTPIPLHIGAERFYRERQLFN